MGRVPGLIGSAEIEFVGLSHQGRNLFVHIADLIQQRIAVLVIARAKIGMGGAMICQKMTFARDARQYVGMKVNLFADDEEGGLTCICLSASSTSLVWALGPSSKLSAIVWALRRPE
jgi:hypothetical protein